MPTDDMVDHALVERRFLEAYDALDGIVELVMIDHADCPKGYYMVDRDASLSGNLQQGSYSDMPSFLCVKFGSASEHSRFLLDVEAVPQKKGCSRGFSTLKYKNSARAHFNDAYRVQICVKYGAKDNDRPLLGLYLSADETCPPFFTAMGLRGSNFASEFDGNLNHHSYPGIAVYLCQSSIAIVPPLQAGKNESIVIIGAHFAKEGNQVRVGEKDCPVTSEGPGRIECIVGEGIGEKEVIVTVPKIGYAEPRPHKDPNVALGRYVRLKGNVAKGYGGTRAMVDGVAYTNPFNCGRFDMVGGQLYMVIDLGQVEHVHQVMLYAYNKQEAWSGARVYVGPYPQGKSMPFTNQNKLTQCVSLAGNGTFTADDLVEYDCGGGIAGRYVVVQSMKWHLQLCEIEVYAEPRRPREFSSIIKFETGVETVNNVRCRGDRPCIRLPLFGGVHMSLTGRGFGNNKDVSVSIETASGFKLCDLKSHNSTGIECVSSSRPRLSEYQCQSGVHLDRRYIIGHVKTDSALQCMTKCSSMGTHIPPCQSLMWHSGHKNCYLSSAPRLPKDSTGCDNTVANLDAGNNQCCTKNNPCTINEGRCNGDSTCRAGMKCNVKCWFNNDDTCCSDPEGGTYRSWMTCSNPSVVLDEAIVSFKQKSNRREIARATFGIEWNNDMSPTIERVTTLVGGQDKTRSCATLGWLTKMSLPVCGLVLDLDNKHYTPVDNLNRYSSASHDTCQAGSMIDGKNQAWCALKPGKNDISVGHITLDLVSSELVAGVVTQGRGYGQFVTKIQVAYSLDGKGFKFVVDSNKKRRVFTANNNEHTKVYNKFDLPMVARFVRVHPWDFKGHPSMRVGVILKARKLRTVYSQCLGPRTFDSAKKYCASVGGRLCSSKEVFIKL